MNSIKNLFWIEGNDAYQRRVDTAKDIKIIKKKDVSETHESSSLYDIKDTFSKNLPIEITVFNNQLELLRSAISDDIQLMNVVMINLKQNYPNITKDKLLAMFEQCLDDVVDITNNAIHINSSNIDLEIDKISENLDDICAEIDDLESKASLLELSKNTISKSLTDKRYEKTKIIADIDKDSEILDESIQNSITLINKI